MGSNKHYFPKVMAVNPSYIGIKERYVYQYPLIKKYLEKKVGGWNFWDFFNCFGNVMICIYADTEFAELIMADYRLYDGNAKVEYMSDRNYALLREKYADLKLIAPDEMADLYKAGKIDYIVICSMFHLNDIYLELINKGFEQDALLPLSCVIAGD